MRFLLSSSWVRTNNPPPPSRHGPQSFSHFLFIQVQPTTPDPFAWIEKWQTDRPWVIINKPKGSRQLKKQTFLLLWNLCELFWWHHIIGHTFLPFSSYGENLTLRPNTDEDNLRSKINNMKNLSHEWLHNFMCSI